MAKIVLAIGSSHAPILNSPPEEAHLHVEIDRTKRPYYDNDGKPTTFEALAAEKDPAIAAEIEPDVISRRVARCLDCIDLVSKRLNEAEPDIVIVIGDDQHEQFFEDNMPAISVYWGETIINNVLDLPDDAPEFWKKARSMYHEDDGPVHYPVASKLGLHLIDHLMDNDFDISHATKLSNERGEGHAFGFVHKRLMRDRIVPMLPISLNTYFAPNQPRPKRCYTLGNNILAAVNSWSEDVRVAIVASGGLSHFMVDEELDRSVLAACAQHDAMTLKNIPVKKLNAGNSEIRNWITTAGAATDLKFEWQEYVPYYRSEVGTGVGAAFLVWS